MCNKKINISPLYDYYVEKNFNPTLIDLESKDKLITHFFKRLNLYVNKLKLSPLMFRNANVLEIGCSSGENALVIAKMGANFDFIEPRKQSTDRLTDLFTKFHLKSSICRISNTIIENLSSDQKYDIIIAEGFLGTLSNRNSHLSQLLNLIDYPGLCIVSSSDPYGLLVELTKIFIFQFLDYKKQLLSDNDKFQLATNLFEKEYNSIPHSRSFKRYYLDTFVNPLGGYKRAWGMEEMLPVAEKENFTLFSSWPYYGIDDDLLWHKHVKSTKEKNKELLNQYFLRCPSYIASEVLTQHDLHWATNFLNSIKDYMHEIDYLANNKFEGSQKLLHKIKKIKYMLKEQYPGSKTFTLFDNIEKLILVLNDDSRDFIDQYNKSILPVTWGIPYHYKCFSQNIESSVKNMLS